LSREASLAYQLSTDGKFLISDTGKKGEIQIKHIKSGRLVKSLKLSKNHWVKDLRLTPDGKIIVLDTKGIVSIFLEEKWINRQETRKSI